MRILNHIRVIYYSLVLWLESFGSESKSGINQLPSGQVTREDSRKNVKLQRGVRKLVQRLRSMSMSERQNLIDNEINLLGQDKTRKLTTKEKMDVARAASRLNKSPKSEGEVAMSETFVKNQTKYKLQNRRKELHKELRTANVDRQKQITTELKSIKSELYKYE